MSFLIFNEKTAEVTEKPEIRGLDYITIIRNKDKTPDKIFFRNVLKYIYHVYKKDHYFENLSINERKVKTSELYLNGQNIDQYEDDYDVQRLIKFYISLEYSQNEWTYQKLKNDIETVTSSINDIPMKKVVSFDQEEEYEIKCPECKEKSIHIIKIKKDIEVDNTKERIESLKQIFTLQDMKEKFRNIIEVERKTKEHNQELTLLEQKYFDK